MGLVDPGVPWSSKGHTGGLILSGQGAAEVDEDGQEENKHSHGGIQGNRVYTYMRCPSGKRMVCMCVVYIYKRVPGGTGIGGPG